MPGKLTPPSQDSYANTEAWRDQQSVYGLLTGQGAWGAPVSLTSYDDDAEYNTTIQNQGSGGHLNIPGLLQVTNGGIFGADARFVNLTVEADTTLGTGAGDALTVNATAGFLADASFAADVVLGDASGDALTVNATPTFLAAATFRHNVTIQNSALTTLALFDVTAGAQQITLGSGTGVAFLDVANARAIVGSTTPLAGAADDKLSVVGGALHVSGTTVGTALGIRHTIIGGVWLIGATAAANPDLVFKDDSGTEIVRFGDATSTYQLAVDGDADVSGDLNVGAGAAIASGLSANRGVLGATTWIGAEKLRVVGTTRLEGATEVTTGGITLASAGNIDGNGGTAGELRIGAVIANAASLSGGEKLRVGGAAVIDGAGYIGDTSNANATLGLTINQGAADDEILAFKSSDVAHGVTSVVETDTFGDVLKGTAADGGLRVRGFSEATIGLYFLPVATTENNTRSTAASASLVVDSLLKSGTTVTAMSANVNMVTFRNNGTARFILDSDGDSHQDAGRTLRAAGGAADDTGVGWTNYDTVDDVQALDALAVSLAREGDPLREQFLQGFAESRAFLESMPGKPLVAFNDGPGEDGHAFVNMSRLTMLLTGAVRQLGREASDLRSQLARVEARLVLAGGSEGHP